MDRSGHVLFREQLSDDPVLHLLLVFGFQRISVTIQTPGIHRREAMLGATAGRTTLNGEGFAASGWSQSYSASTPFPTACRTILPMLTAGSNPATVCAACIRNGKTCSITLHAAGKNYEHGDIKVCERAFKGMYLLKEGDDTSSSCGCSCWSSASILREVEAAAKSCWMCTASVPMCGVSPATTNCDDGMEKHRNMLHPLEEPRLPYVTKALRKSKAPVVATSDHMKVYADQIARLMYPQSFHRAGYRWFDRSDSREQLRHFFRSGSLFRCDCRAECVGG
ncbi:MAG: hypothetical protein R3F38_05010 [Gammaproteobacteria bacterium]